MRYWSHQEVPPVRGQAASRPRAADVTARARPSARDSTAPAPPPADPRPAKATRRRSARRVAAALVATQGLLLVALGVFLVVRGFGADTTSRGRAETGGLFAVLGGAGFMLLARGVLARRQWARSPTLVCEFLSLPVAYGLLQGHKYAYGVPLAASGLAGLVLLVAASAAGGGRDEQDMRTGHGDDGGT